MDFLVTDLGGEHVLLGLPWLWKTNPQINWKGGHLSVPKRGVEIEEVEDEEKWAGTGKPPLSNAILESIKDPFKTIHASIIKTPLVEPEDSTPLYHIMANQATRRSLVKKGILEDCHNKVATAWVYFMTDLPSTSEIPKVSSPREISEMSWEISLKKHVLSPKGLVFQCHVITMAAQRGKHRRPTSRALE
ncbi:hypothetical protein PM082_024960 [Marasmius tenuissimus]|nr:hypothetical protein PM082_024960 [Marasmius tenuissimus]